MEDQLEGYEHFLEERAAAHEDVVAGLVEHLQEVEGRRACECQRVVLSEVGPSTL